MSAHPRMSAVECHPVYRLAWQRYYTIDHITTIMRRVAASEGNASNALFLITWFVGSIEFEKIHPLESGFFRLKFRSDRRPGLPRETAWRFYRRYFGETTVKLVKWIALYLRLRRIYLRIKRDPQHLTYVDVAMRTSEDTGTLGLFGTDAAKAYIRQQRRLQDIRNGEAAAVGTPSQS